MRGDHSLVSVTFGKDFAFNKAELSDGLERPLESLQFDKPLQSFDVEIKPFKILTILLSI